MFFFLKGPETKITDHLEEEEICSLKSDIVSSSSLGTSVWIFKDDRKTVLYFNW